MAEYQIRDMPDELYEKVKKSAADEGRSINKQLIEFIKEAIAAREKNILPNNG